MLRTLFKKGWKAIRQQVKAINTPWGGVQLSEPAPDLTFSPALRTNGS